MQSNLHLLGAGAHRAHRGHDFPPHRHTCWELVFYREGRIEAPIGDEVFFTRPGLLLLTPPGLMHAERAVTAYSNYYITLTSAIQAKWPRQVSDDARGSLAYIFRSIIEEFARESQNGAVNGATESLVPLLMAHLEVFLSRVDAIVPQPIGESLVREAERIFEEVVSQDIAIADVAARIGIAPSVLRAHFATFRGYSPSEALFRVRQRQALALLQSSDLSLREVAATCGFHSPSHLSRHVRAITGEAPGRWRRAHSRNGPS